MNQTAKLLELLGWYAMAEHLEARLWMERGHARVIIGPKWTTFYWRVSSKGGTSIGEMRTVSTTDEIALRKQDAVFQTQAKLTKAKR